ncbi:DUF4864 domain-containing protein [bacterium]|nr:DUF4864 domain-containing protein [bacterium]
MFAFFAGKFFMGVMDPPRTVKEHIKALNDGDFNIAYSYFSVDYRRKHSFAAFKSEIDAFSDSLPVGETSLNRVNIQNEKATVEGMLTGRNGVVFPVRYMLVREKRQWKIEEFDWEPPGEQQTI